MARDNVELLPWDNGRLECVTTKSAFMLDAATRRLRLVLGILFGRTRHSCFWRMENNPISYSTHRSLQSRHCEVQLVFETCFLYRFVVQSQ